MLKKAALIVTTILLLSAYIDITTVTGADLSPSVDRHMKNVSQITFEGDNAEAYFSPDGRRLIYH